VAGLAGGKPDRIKVAFDGEPIDDASPQGLMTHREGLYDLA
jgi:hypothetical protein